MVEPGSKTDFFEQILPLFIGFIQAHAREDHRQSDIFQGCHDRNQVEGLKAGFWGQAFGVRLSLFTLIIFKDETGAVLNYPSHSLALP